MRGAPVFVLSDAALWVALEGHGVVRKEARVDREEAAVGVDRPAIARGVVGEGAAPEGAGACVERHRAAWIVVSEAA